jgi:hypothetical protein
VLALLALASFGILTTVGECGGDGGSPFAAPASPQGKFCRTFESLGLLYVAFVPALMALATRWSRRTRSSSPFFVASCLAVLAVLAPHLVSAVLADTCPGGNGSAPVEQFPDRPDCWHY